jgi:arginase
MTTTSMIQPKFLTKGAQLGIVAVGFSGGQVCEFIAINNPT